MVLDASLQPGYISLFVVGLVVLVMGVGGAKRVILLGVEMDLEHGQRRNILIALGIVVCSVSVMGFLGIIGTSGDAKGATVQSSPSPSPSTSSASIFAPVATVPSGTPTTVNVTLKLPVDKTRAIEAGTTVSGTVRGDLGTSTLWLFTWSDGAWYRQQQIAVAPDQSFQADSGQLGVAQDAGKTFTLGIFLANSNQTKTIKSAQKNADGDVVFSRPPGLMMASRVVVRS
jgi:hypothetical protein